MLNAQGLGEYAGIAGSSAGGALGAESSPLQNGINWLQHSWQDDRGLWIGAIVCVMLGIRFYSRRQQ